MKFKGLTEEEFDWVVKCLVVFALVYFSYSVARADTIKVAVIDTGFDFNSKWDKSKLTKPKICSSGHKDFTNTSINDTNSHGTHINSLIALGNLKTDYCLVVLKFWDKKSLIKSLDAEIKAIEYAINLKVKVINLSVSGSGYSKEECDLLTKALNKGIKIIVAAGNEGINLDIAKHWGYPAMCSKRIMIAVNGKGERNISSASNFSNGKNVYVIDGQKIKGLGIGDAEITMSGTSQSAALLTSKIIKDYK